MSVTVAQERVEAYRERSKAAPGLYLLAVHASLAAAVNAELLHHLRDNFLLEVDQARRLPVTAAVEAGMAQLLLSPLFREVGDGLWEMDPEVRSVLLAELATLDGGQRMQDVAALLERYTRDEAPWQDWPELREAQLVSAWAQLDPQAAEKWLAAGSSQGSATGVDAGWFVAMRRKLDEAKQPFRPPESAGAPGLSPEAVLATYGRAAVAVGQFSGVRLTENGLLVVAAPTSLGDENRFTVTGGDRRTRNAVLVSTSPDRRLAFLVEVPGPSRPVAPLDVTPTPIGSPVYVVPVNPSSEVLSSSVVTPPVPARCANRLGALSSPVGVGDLVVSPEHDGGVLGLTQGYAVEGHGFTPAEVILDALADDLGQFFLRALEQKSARGVVIDPDSWYQDGSRLLYDGGRHAAAARLTLLRGVYLADHDREGEARAAFDVAAAIVLEERDPGLRDQVMDLIVDTARSVLGEEVGFPEPGTPEFPAELVALSHEFETIRSTQEASGDRTRAMGSVVERMRGQVTADLLPALTASTHAGLRLAAVVTLQDAPDVAWVEWLGGCLEEERPFVGYQASVALRNAAEYLPPRHLPALQEAVDRAELAMASQPGTDRAAMLRVTAQILTDRRRTRSGKSTKRLPFDWKLWDTGQVVRIRFLDGTPEQHQRVAKVAKEWVAKANLTFEFLPYPSTAPSHVRITFSQPGAWSFAGATARAIAQKEPTACIGPEFTTDPTAFEYTIRRQFGHILGLINEHQNPNATIPWDTEAAYRSLTGPPNFWKREDVDRNLLQRYDIDNYRDFDPDSVMLWEISPDLTHGERIGGKQRLSRSDVAFVGRLYPRREPPS